MGSNNVVIMVPIYREDGEDCHWSGFARLKVELDNRSDAKLVAAFRLRLVEDDTVHGDEVGCSRLMYAGLRFPRKRAIDSVGSWPKLYKAPLQRWL
jgi:hypothetical protein